MQLDIHRRVKAYINRINIHDAAAVTRSCELVEAAYLLKKDGTCSQDNLQLLLDRIAGCKWGDITLHKCIARSIQQALMRLRLRIKCPKCGAPSPLRHAPGSRGKLGNFRFQHSAKSKKEVTHANRTSFPQNLELIPAP